MKLHGVLALFLALIAAVSAAAQSPAKPPATDLVAVIRRTLKEPETAARNARLERLADQLDRLPDTELDKKIDGHFTLQIVDAAIRRHAMWLITGARTWDAARRQKYGPRLVDSYIQLAEALANDGANDEALALLRQTVADLPEVPTASKSVKGPLARLELIGKAGAPLTAPRWLNRPPGVTTLDPRGKVTLIEFSAHWCAPCTQSYPALNRFRKTYGPRGFQAVIATELYGYFAKEKSLTPEVELARDRAYFARHGLDIPVAIGNKVDVEYDGDEFVYTPARDPNHLSYRVGGLPQFYLLDRQGRVRYVLSGYEKATEAKLAKLVRLLVEER